MKWLALALALSMVGTSSGCWRPYYGRQYAPPAVAQPTFAPSSYGQPGAVVAQPAPVAQPAQVVAQPQMMQCQPCVPCCVPCY